jgi:hypothetical protein
MTSPELSHHWTAVLIKGLRNFVVAHAKYNISHRNYPGGTEQKLSSVV